jgi:outer membrane protein
MILIIYKQLKEDTDLQRPITKLRNLVCAASLLLAAAGSSAQASIDLPQAVAIALEKNPERKMAIADIGIARAQVSLARSGYFPRVSFTETATTGDDPIYVFGTRLRQGRFTQADFALSHINHPEPIGNFASRFGGQWNLFDSFAKIYQLRSAKLVEQATVQQLDRTDQEIIFRVLDSYYSIGVARKQVEVAEQLVKTASAVLDSSTARVEAGSAVESDALLARVNLASRQQDLIQAQNNLQVATTQFETALGAELATGQRPVALLNEPTVSAAPLEEAQSRALKQRADLQAMASQVEAQRSSVKAAKAAYGPRLDVYGSWQADSPSGSSDASGHWQAGAELRIDLFSRDREARLSAERASLSRAEATRKMAEDNIRLDVRKAWFDHDASRQMLDVSRASVQHAEESLRMVRDRYEAGLATITDLLRAEDADRTSRVNYWHSVYRYIVTYAALELASGELTPHSRVVMQ